MKNIVSWLKKPYFFDPSAKIHLLIALSVGFFIFTFLFLFQPFGMSDLDNNLFYYSLGFGLVTFLSQSFMFILIPFLFKDVFNSDKWTIGKNIIFLFSLVSVISFCNWLYNNEVQSSNNWRLLTLTEIFSYTFSISIFPIFGLTYFNEKVYRKKREKKSKKIMNFRVSTKVEELKETVTIFGDNNKDNITFKIDNLLYITSVRNYVSFYLIRDKDIEEKVLRNTLSTVFKQLCKYSNIIRCHKSYIINSNFIDAISGNARGYFLESEKISKKIPVSRKFPKEELKNLIN